MNLVDGTKIFLKEEEDCEELDNICETCVKAKQTRWPFSEERKEL